MRALALAFAALAAALGAFAASPGGSPPGPGAASAADCLLVEHSKKHIHKRKVRRDGKRVTVRKKHTHRWTTCEPVPDPPKPTCTVPSSAVQVISRDSTGSTYSLSRPCVNAGAVKVELVNQGEDPHNVFLRPAGSGNATPDPAFGIPDAAPFELAPMGVQDRTFTLSAGSWYLWCSLTEHEEQGMHATLEVK